jgi:aspartate racemase
MDTTPNPGNVRQHCLGMIGGLGVAAAIHYYRELVNEHALRGAVPDRLIAHADVNRTLRDAAAGNTSALAQYLAAFIERLTRAGATIAAIPSVTAHICAPQLIELLTIPFISLPAEVLREINRQQFKRVALMGTRFTIETDMFGQLPGIEVIKPAPAEIDLIHQTYVQLAKDGVGSAEQYDRLRALAHTLCDRDGIDAIILAGTDLSLLFNTSNIDFPHIDAAHVHIQSIMRRLFDIRHGPKPWRIWF